MATVLQTTLNAFLYAKQLYLSQISRKLFHHEAERAITGSDAYVPDLIELKYHVLNCVLEIWKYISIFYLGDVNM